MGETWDDGYCVGEWCCFAGTSKPPHVVASDRGSAPYGLLYARSVHVWATTEASEGPPTNTGSDTGVAGGSGMVSRPHMHIPTVGISCNVHATDSVALWSTVRQLGPAQYMTTLP